MLVFAVHLNIQGARTSEVAAEVCMGTAYLLGGVMHWVWPNNAGLDGKGAVGFWATGLVAFAFMTASCIFHARFARHVLLAAKVPRKCCGGKTAVSVLAGLVVAFGALVIIGHLWCLGDSDLHTSNWNMDVDLDGFNATDVSPACVKMIFFSEAGWYISYSAFWIPWASVMFAVTKPRWEVMWGLAVPVAAIGTAVITWTIGFMYDPQSFCLCDYCVFLSPSSMNTRYMIWVNVAAMIAGGDGGEYYDKAKGAVVYHFGTCLAFLLAHNVSNSESCKLKK
jgi:hypothetical protein